MLRIPVSRPTAVPSTVPTQRVENDTLIVLQPGVYNRSDISVRRFVVNSTSDVQFVDRGGASVFHIVPNHGVLVTVQYFDHTADVVDLREFVMYRQLSDLNITRGSAVVHLIHGQTVYLGDVAVEDMASDNFQFHSPAKADAKHSEDATLGSLIAKYETELQILLGVVGLLMVGALLCCGRSWHLRRLRHKKLADSIIANDRNPTLVTLTSGEWASLAVRTGSRPGGELHTPLSWSSDSSSRIISGERRMDSEGTSSREQTQRFVVNSSRSRLASADLSDDHSCFDSVDDHSDQDSEASEEASIKTNSSSCSSFVLSSESFDYSEGNSSVVSAAES